MGKRTIPQKRGKGSPAYRTPSHRFKSPAKYRNIQKTIRAEVVKFIDDPGKTNILALLKYDDMSTFLVPATEGLVIGDIIWHGPEAETKIGSIIPLGKIPEGYPIFNIEAKPGDGGKLVRSSGACAYTAAKQHGKVLVKLPSGQMKELHESCLATLGCAAGGGRTKKPILKAGNSHYKMHARNHRWPTTRGVKMNVVSHPFGGKGHHGNITTKGKGGSPGQHVGSFGSSRTGRRNK